MLLFDSRREEEEVVLPTPAPFSNQPKCLANIAAGKETSSGIAPAGIVTARWTAAQLLLHRNTQSPPKHKGLPLFHESNCSMIPTPAIVLVITTSSHSSIKSIKLKISD